MPRLHIIKATRELDGTIGMTIVVSSTPSREYELVVKFDASKTDDEILAELKGLVTRIETQISKYSAGVET